MTWFLLVFRELPELLLYLNFFPRRNFFSVRKLVRLLARASFSDRTSLAEHLRSATQTDRNDRDNKLQAAGQLNHLANLMDKINFAFLFITGDR